ncbi:GbsR/MarR family transcriptional regulator [Streptomyces sp. T12]|uniref:GbsR/MarR family transcriptional regulator n=1 Tax=Streptomyces sp. T12 TaxID=477697 RepID=UPI0021BD5B88|nr:helix-turn-helix domain-containing protein [Streptomyces sp. T12]
MPGGRLTQQERQRIASGLADGLAYAEIARRLDRPTSTVTREVMRNGGPTAYRAELAQRAAERRAHRRTRAAARGQKAAPDQYGRDPEAVRAYEETLTTVFIASGTPRMMARVMACLTLSDSGSLTAAELAERLRVSPASVSKAVAFLESQDLVRRFRDEGRRERYGFDEDIWYQSMVASARSTAQIAVTSREGVDVMGPGTPAATRLENAARFLDFVSTTMIRAAEEARDLLLVQPAPDAEGAESHTAGTDADRSRGREE